MGPTISWKGRKVHTRLLYPRPSCARYGNRPEKLGIHTGYTDVSKESTGFSSPFMVFSAHKQDTLHAVFIAAFKKNVAPPLTVRA